MAEQEPLATMRRWLGGIIQCLMVLSLLCWPAMADETPANVCGNDAVIKTVVAKLRTYFQDEQPNLGGDGKAGYSTEKKIYVCAINWRTSDKRGRLIFTVKFNPPQVDIYRVLEAKAESGGDYDATCDKAREMVKVAVAKKAYTVLAGQLIRGKVVWADDAMISGRPSPNDSAVTLCVSNLMIDWPPANFGIGTSYAKRDYVVSYAVTAYPDGRLMLSDVNLN